MTDQLAPGLRLTKEGICVVEGDPNLSAWVEQVGRLDLNRGELDLYGKYVPKGGVVVNAGASIGDHTLMFADVVGPEGQVFAFEPHPLSFAALEYNMRFRPNVLTYNYALSNNAVSLDLEPQQNIGASRIGPAKPHSILVKCMTLDSLEAIFPRWDFFFLDAEGWEPHVLAGAKNVIAKFKPVIVLEINHGCLAANRCDEATLTKQLEDMGYCVQELHKDNGPHCPQRDVLALPR